jgi:hypothetical protein
VGKSLAKFCDKSTHTTRWKIFLRHYKEYLMKILRYSKTSTINTVRFLQKLLLQAEYYSLIQIITISSFKILGTPLKWLKFHEINMKVLSRENNRHCCQKMNFSQFLTFCHFLKQEKRAQAIISHTKCHKKRPLRIFLLYGMPQRPFDPSPPLDK